MSIFISSAHLRKDLASQYNIVCFEDLGKLSQSRELIYQVFQKHYQESYTPNQRLVLYAKESIPLSFLDHIFKAANLIDISVNFILLVAPHASDFENYLRNRYPRQDNCFGFEDAAILDANVFSPPSEYHIPDTICPLPWISISVSGDGNMTPCCIYSADVLSDHNEKFNVNLHTPEQYYYSQHIADLRQSLLNGEKPLGCQNCWFKEQNGNKSVRQHSLSLYNKKFLSQSVSATLDRVINLDFDFGNLCNLKCRICTYQRSSSIAADIITKGNRFVNVSRNTIKKFNQNAKWISDPEKISKFDKIFDNLENIEIEGGEPFFHDYHSRFLEQKLVESGQAPFIRIRFSSNATMFPDHHYWSQFKEIQLCLSIDDIGPRFEYQRDGASWNETKNVLEKYYQLAYEHLKISFWIAVSIQNVFYLPELIDTLDTYGWDFHFNLLQEPQQLSLNNLTENAKLAILEKFKEYQSRNPAKGKMLDFVLNVVHPIIPTDGKSFWEYVDYNDQMRSKYYHDSHPEMANLMNKV